MFSSRALLKDGAIAFSLMATVLLVLSVFGVDPAFAQLIDPTDSPDNISQATGGESSFRALARTIVNFFLYFLGFVATVMIIYGGILYVTSAGNDENVQKAKKILVYSLVGIVVILLSFAIVNTVIGAGSGNIANT